MSADPKRGNIRPARSNMADGRHGFVTLCAKSGRRGKREDHAGRGTDGGHADGCVDFRSGLRTVLTAKISASDGLQVSAKPPTWAVGHGGFRRIVL